MFRRIWTHGIDAPIANTFKFQVVYAAPGTFTLPINTGGAGYVHNFTVNWGDGTPDSTINSFDDPDRIHTYAGAGTYDITMTGVCEWFGFNNAGDKTKITKLLDFSGDIGFKVLNFTGCSNLTTIIPLGRKLALTYVSNLFRQTGITSVPSGLFAGCPNLTLCTGVFGNMVGPSTVPADLFRYNPLVTGFGGLFTSCTGLTVIPDDLFKYNPLVTGFGGMGNGLFTNCQLLTSIPVDLFRYNTEVKGFAGVFRGCTGLTSIPINLFRYNTLATSFTGAFSGCIGITSIPVDLFRYNTLVTIFGGVSYPEEGVFSGCSGITSVLDPNIFLNNLVAANFGNAFLGCANMTGNGQPIIDNTALPGHSVPTATACCFNGCIGLTDYATIPAGWK